MSDSVAQENGEQAEAPKDEAAADTTDWKAEARKWEDRAKANKAAADKAATLEKELADAQNSLTEATEKLAGYEARKQHVAWVKEVLAEVELPDSYADVLRGETKDALLAHAEALKPLIGSVKADPVPDAGKTPEIKTTPERQAVRELFGAR